MLARAATLVVSDSARTYKWCAAALDKMQSDALKHIHAADIMTEVSET